MKKTFKTSDASLFVTQMNGILKEFGYKGQDLSWAMRSVSIRGNAVTVGQPICEDGCVMARLRDIAPTA